MYFDRNGTRERNLGDDGLEGVRVSLVFLGTVGLTKGMDVPRRWFLCYVSPLALLVAFNTYVFRLSDYVALVAVIVAVNIYLLSANHFRWAGVCVAVFPPWTTKAAMYLGVIKTSP